ncbi:MAG: ABC transporter substrate-binding protein [Kordiimonadaceae bacterium]|nr:ABC transporter substrate-binding protein [Kordiimonadaceae bacterium]MBO6570638.1 ABC transporter substrate-binding protein [Kordiimonadaceae bacterium]MBO6966504.1 ABC transporter substrate-binding protein [Kordiimonadaceae bacterium]
MKKITSFLTVLLVFCVPAFAQDKAVDDTRGAIEFVEGLASETIAVWSDSKLTEAERTIAFRQIFEQATDINLLARGMLGRHFRTATADQRTRYMQAMSDYIVYEFDKRMTQIGFRELEVVGTKPASGRNGHVFVRTEVQRDDGAPILADWRIRKSGGKFQIVNLEFEGINLMITNRDVFGAKVKDVGLDGLIDWLKEQSVTES